MTSFEWTWRLWRSRRYRFGGHGEDLAASHLVCDNQIMAAQTGWVGTSAAALEAKMAVWLERSRMLIAQVGELAFNLNDDAIRFATMEEGHATALGAVAEVLDDIDDAT